MHVLPYIVAYAAILVFLVAVLARIAMWSKLPMHMRWELYPVAHEPGKAQYGGSYLEEFEWWTKPRETSLSGELGAMIPEIVFLVALKEHNRKMWNRSFPFHFGLYLVIASTCLLILGAILTAAAPSLMLGTVGTLLHAAAWITGVVGILMALWGALGLLGRRLGAPDLKDYTTPVDIFNLVFFVVAFGCALATFLLVDRDFSLVTAFVTGLVTFEPAALPLSGPATALPMATAVLLSLLLAYIPLTHMSHFVGKYFAYHAVRWNDTPNLPGGREEATIGELLNQPVTWSAPHIRGDGKRTWAQVASEGPDPETAKPEAGQS